MEATPELRALLGRRLRIVEGQSGSFPPNRMTRHSPNSPSRLPGSSPSGRPVRGSVLNGAHCATSRVAQLRQTVLQRDARVGHALETRVGALTLRNEQLSQEVEKMKAKLLKDEVFSEERSLLLAETDELLKQTDVMTMRSRHVMRQREELRAEELRMEASKAEASAKLVEELETYRAECESMQSKNDELKEQEMNLESRMEQMLSLSESYEHSASYAEAHAEEVEALKRQNEMLDMEITKMKTLRDEDLGHAAEVALLRAENVSLRQGQDNSVGRLRAAMLDQTATPEQLRSAIGAAESLIDEARRELANKQLRERRAAYEELAQAVDQGDEDRLDAAVNRARRAEVNADDLGKAEAKLAELRALTSEEREAKAAKELETKRKKEAFLLIKKDDAEGLLNLLNQLDAANTRWKEWRDYSGRTMWDCAKDLRAKEAQNLLAPLMKPRAAEDGSPKSLTVSPRRRLSAAFAATQAAGDRPEAQSRENEVTQVETPSKSQWDPLPDFSVASSSSQGGVPGASQCDPESNPVRAISTPAVEPKVSVTTPLSAEEEQLKAKALRAVVQDDGATLGSIIGSLPMESWSRWQNKAGKDLITLSQERGSSCAYSVLAKALGMMKEMKREAFEEREAVWVFTQGDVQPRRATVLEDTPEEAEAILLEYWDGDDPPESVERCMVRKMWS